jgi:hypothetical protein
MSIWDALVQNLTCQLKFALFVDYPLHGVKNGKNVGMKSNIAPNAAVGDVRKLKQKTQIEN